MIEAKLALCAKTRLKQEFRSIRAEWLCGDLGEASRFCQPFMTIVSPGILVTLEVRYSPISSITKVLLVNQ
jgi:hypothetical protein